MTKLNKRRHDLDWLRIIAFLLLIFYHIGMFYVPWDWHVKSVHAGEGAEPLMSLLNPWRLSLLFFISGVALPFLSAKLGGGGLARDRVVRMGLPILAGGGCLSLPRKAGCSLSRAASSMAVSSPSIRNT